MLTSDNAHDLDINVLSWNRNDAFLVSGGDDGITKIWDLRQFKVRTGSLRSHPHIQAVGTPVG